MNWSWGPGFPGIPTDGSGCRGVSEPDHHQVLSLVSEKEGSKLAPGRRPTNQEEGTGAHGEETESLGACRSELPGHVGEPASGGESRAGVLGSWGRQGSTEATK